MIVGIFATIIGVWVAGCFVVPLFFHVLRWYLDWLEKKFYKY